ncbi:MAG: hypothetical protein J3R72DRAFT_263771 [Linnemannia gamsii]|nr:MAG: hypothetical protein J3R72DRAFT_263771 [Linnemannia gamsii]
MASISPGTTMSANQTPRTFSIGSLGDQILAHRFFHLVDARHWHQVEKFHLYRDINHSAQRHADIYKADLERISAHGSVPDPLRKTALKLAKHFKNDEFVESFSKATDRVGERRAIGGVRSLHFGIMENVDTPPAERLGSKRSWNEEHTLRSSTTPEHASNTPTDAFTHRSSKDQIGEDDSTLDGHRDFESAAANNDGELDRVQEAEGSEDGDDDDLDEIIIPHDFHGLFEALYRASFAYFCI